MGSNPNPDLNPNPNPSLNPNPEKVMEDVWLGSLLFRDPPPQPRVEL